MSFPACPSVPMSGSTTPGKRSIMLLYCNQYQHIENKGAPLFERPEYHEDVQDIQNYLQLYLLIFPERYRAENLFYSHLRCPLSCYIAAARMSRKTYLDRKVSSSTTTFHNRHFVSRAVLIAFLLYSDVWLHEYESMLALTSRQIEIKHLK